MMTWGVLGRSSEQDSPGGLIVGKAENLGGCREGRGCGWEGVGAETPGIQSQSRDVVVPAEGTALADAGRPEAEGA